MFKLKFFKSLFLLVFMMTCSLRIITYDLFAEDKIIAIVNNDIITQKDLYDFINFMRMQLGEEYEEERLENEIQAMKSDLLERLIEDRLILQEAKKNKINLAENRIKAKVNEIKRNYSSDAEFQNALSQRGMVQADIETRIREQALMHQIIEMKVKSRVVVKPIEVTEFYEENTEEFIIPEQREFESILIEDKDLSTEIYAKLKAGEEFADLAKQYSLKVNKINAKPGQLRKDVEDVVFGIALQETSEPIEIDNKYYIFKLVKITPSYKKSFSESQDKIYTFLFEKKMQEELTEWLEELKEQSYIKVLDDEKS